MLFAPTPLFLASLAAPQPNPLAAPARTSPERVLSALGPAAQRGSNTIARKWNPSWVVAIGLHSVDGSHDFSDVTPQDPSSDEQSAKSIDLVFYNWQDERGIGLEFGLMANTYDVDVSALETETVDSYRATIGMRLADRGPKDTFWVPYARAGFLYRIDSGDTYIDDSGYGWYAGGGVDFTLGSHFALTPQVLYTDNTSLSSNEWLFGVLVTVGF